MEWYKRKINTRHDPKIGNVMIKFGLKGVGAYDLLVELIHSNLKPNCPETYGKPDKACNLEYIAKMVFFITVEETKELIDFFADINLIDCTEWHENNTIYMPKAIDYASEYTKKCISKIRKKCQNKNDQSTKNVRIDSEHSTKKIRQSTKKISLEREEESNTKESVDKKSTDKKTLHQAFMEVYHNMYLTKYNSKPIINAMTGKHIQEFIKICDKNVDYFNKLLQYAMFTAEKENVFWANRTVDTNVLIRFKNDIINGANGKIKPKKNNYEKKSTLAEFDFDEAKLEAAKLTDEDMADIIKYERQAGII